MSKKKSMPGKGVEGMLRGLGDLVEKLGDLAEKGEQLKHSGEFETRTGDGRDVTGAFGVSVKFGIGGQEPDVVPLDKHEEVLSESVVKETAEPPVDVFDEGDVVQVVAELPGIGREDVELRLHGDVLTIHAEHGPKKYYKELLLPYACSDKGIELGCNNGILEIRLKRITVDG